MPELIKAIISPSELSRPKVSRLANKSERGMTMSKEEGNLNRSNFPTSRKEMFSTKSNSVKSNIIPMNNMKLKNRNPKIKDKIISFRI